ncbi:head GIN domain-containing protein [Mariniphaga sediminis]|uniref:head GIN domain-containing protein n=1 Tax=Mariniphaga sediminis TaxID=1628158 RepID=UPI0035687EFB
MMYQKFPKSGRLIFTLLFLVGVVFSFEASGQNSGRESKTYETGEFNHLFLEGAFSVQLIQGRQSSLVVEASDGRAFDYLEVTNNDGLLHLHVDRKPFDLTKITLLVTFENLEYLHIFGGIRLDTHGYLDLDDLTLLLEGGAKVDLKVKARRVEVENKGGVLCELSGVAESLDVRLAGAGHINAGELKARDVDFKIEGVGTGRVFATETLYARINGAGKVKYRGNPEVTQEIEGLGSVSRE